MAEDANDFAVVDAKVDTVQHRDPAIAGAKAANPRYVGSTSYRAKGEDVVCAFYRMDLVELGEGEEDRDVRWVPLSELEEAMPFPESVALVQLAVELG